MTILRLPQEGSRWVWEIDKERVRVLVEVKEVRFNGEEWWVTTRSLPDAPTPASFAQVDPSLEARNTLDRFWEAAIPVDGRYEDLSNPISQEQYDGEDLSA